MDPALERILLIFDLHAPYNDKPSTANAHLFARDFIGSRTNATVGFGGDTYDYYLASKYDRRDNGKGPQLLSDELDLGYETGVKPFLDATPKANDRFALGGNHEARVNNLLAHAAPSLRHGSMRDPEDMQGWRKNGVRYFAPFAGNSTYQLMDTLHITHGWKAGMNAPRQQLARYGRSIVHGHTHKASYQRELMGDGTYREVWSSGCLAQRGPDFAPMPDWSWGFLAGMIDRRRGHVALYHCTAQGKDNQELFTPWGVYTAKRGHGGLWTSKRQIWI